MHVCCLTGAIGTAYAPGSAMNTSEGLRGEVIFPDTWQSLRNMLSSDLCVQSCGFGQEDDHQSVSQLFLLILDFVNPNDFFYFPHLSFFLQ